jgi:hypothetical protein
MKNVTERIGIKNATKRIAKGGFVLGLLTLSAACVVEPREGYWDHDHHRWYHEHAWHECMENDIHCR